MFIHEYGNRDDPTVILLSPMMVSGTDLYGLMSPHFKGSFHFVAPDQGGHAVAVRVFPAQRPAHRSDGNAASFRNIFQSNRIHGEYPFPAVNL